MARAAASGSVCPMTATPSAVRLVAVALLALALAPRAEAAPGDLDPSFGGTGIVSTPIGFPAYGAAEAVAVQPDGKVLVAGRQCAGESCDFALLRHDTDGTPDTSFSGDGESIGFALARYGLDGALDPSFADDGRQTTFASARRRAQRTGPAPGTPGAAGVAIAADVTIAVAGTVGESALGFYDVARYQGGDEPPEYILEPPRTNLTGRVRPKRARRRRPSFTVTGRIRLPDFISAAEGCAGRVTVKIRVIRKGPDKVISHRLTHIRDDCTYRSTARLTAKRLKRHRGTLRFAVRFQGNDRLRPRQIVRKAKFDRRA